MICNKCKAEFADNAEFCPVCGVKLEKEKIENTAVPSFSETENSQKTKNEETLSFFKKVFSSNLFLILTVVTTVVTVSQLLTSNIASLVLMIFSIIPMWSLYSMAKKGDTLLYRFESPIKNLKRIIDIRCSLGWVAIIFAAVSGVLLMVFGNKEYDYSTEKAFFNSLGMEEYYLYDFTMGQVLFALGIGLLVLAAFLLVVLLGYWKTMSKNAESFGYSVQVGGYELKKVKALRVWTVFMAVVNGVMVLLCFWLVEILAALQSIAVVAMYVLANLWLKSLDQ